MSIEVILLAVLVVFAVASLLALGLGRAAGDAERNPDAFRPPRDDQDDGQ